MALYADVATYPPLNQITILPPNYSSPNGPTPIPFTALLTSHRDRMPFRYTVRLHYHPVPSSTTSSTHPAHWPSIPLTGATADSSGAYKEITFVRTDAEREAGEHRRLYRGVLQLPAEPKACRIKFAVRCRTDEFAAWRWVETVGGVKVGEVLLTTMRTGSRTVDVGEVRSLMGLRDGWDVYPCPKSESGEHPPVFVVRSKAWVPKVEDGTVAAGMGLPDKVLGKVRDQVRYMSLVRLEMCWLGVQHSFSDDSSGSFDQSGEGVLVLFLLLDGRTLGMLAFGEEDVYTVMRSGEDGEVAVAARNDGGKEAVYSVLVSVSCSHETVITALTAEAKRRAMKSSQMQKLLQRVDEVGHKKGWVDESWCDGLTYCTWNGMRMHSCDEKAVLEGFDMLKNSGVSVQNFLLDDTWQSTGDEKITLENFAYTGWERFEANSKFPRGLKALIGDVRFKHNNIKYFGVWHTLFGYWGGICDTGFIVNKYKTRRVRTRVGETPRRMLIVDPIDIDRFYDDLYAWLKAQGVDFVKTDAQHMLSMLEDARDREEVPPAYQRAWTAAVCKHFQGRAISCMSQTPQTLFQSLLQNQTPKVLHRNSDDFSPGIPESHPWHIFTNAHNALLTRHLNVLPDWDMFQTLQSHASYHAAARTLSGGPIFITDVPGQHDVDLIEAMTAHSPAGTRIALRPRPAAVSGSPWSRYADGNLCKIGTSTGDGSSVAGLLGVFNITEGEVSELISVNDFPSMRAEKVLVMSQRTGQVIGPLEVSDGVFVNIKVAAGGWDILTAVPVVEAKVPLAVLGLRGKMSGAAAVVKQASLSVESGIKVDLSLKAVGTLGLWIGKTGIGVASVLVNGQEVTGYVTAWEHRYGNVFELDLQQCWSVKSLGSEVQHIIVEMLIG